MVMLLFVHLLQYITFSIQKYVNPTKNLLKYWWWSWHF